MYQDPIQRTSANLVENEGVHYSKQLIWSAPQHLPISSFILSFSVFQVHRDEKGTEHSAPHFPLPSWGRAVDLLTNTNR